MTFSELWCVDYTSVFWTVQDCLPLMLTVPDVSWDWPMLKVGVRGGFKVLWHGISHGIENPVAK